VKLSRLSIAVYVGLVFASGAVLGAFSLRLYTVSTVSAKSTRNPEEWRRRTITEMQTRLKLTDPQVSQLNVIFDETRAQVEETRHQMRPAFQAIHEQQTEKIRAMLSPDQQAEFEKMRLEREQRQKQQKSR
jgi:hypothetical protein